MCKKSLSILLLSFGLLSNAYAADDSKLNKSNKLFDFAEESFPEYFSPSGRETFELDDYWVRYFSKTDTYIGTLGDDVYVYGDVFNGLLHVGKISDFITLGTCVDNFPKPACDGNNEVGKQTGISFQFESGTSCSSSFPEYEYDPVISEEFKGACGFIECGSCATDW
ncbi:MAG: hypothetical protein GQ583_11945 [Methyloprofundus sp.]|nr:hypothetical protein [Methyloprofundus sp.]